ncbi:MAG: hypothetical protein WA862_08290 [Solirubrobacterales bacterium]
MVGLAAFRIGLGAFAWLAPGTMNRIFGVSRADDSPALSRPAGLTAVQALAITAGATAIDLAAMARTAGQ